MKKIEIEYKDLYGNIPKDNTERLKHILDSMNLSNNSGQITKGIQRILNIKWKSLDFIIYLLPKATPRPRHNRFMNTFYVMGAKDNKDIFKKFMLKHDFDMISTPCKFTCRSYFPIPKSMNNAEKILAELGLIRPISKPDWDNIGKTYSDMIQGFLLFDDSLIIKGVSEKYYSSKPRIEIHIEYMEEHDSKFNYNKMRKKVK